MSCREWRRRWSWGSSFLIRQQISIRKNPLFPTVGISFYACIWNEMRVDNRSSQYIEFRGYETSRATKQTSKQSQHTIHFYFLHVDLTSKNFPLWEIYNSYIFFFGELTTTEKSMQTTIEILEITLLFFRNFFFIFKRRQSHFTKWKIDKIVL